jgi:thymidylate synthase
MYIMQAYDDALRHILDHGVRKKNRTGVDTIAVFGLLSKYRIDEHFPIITGRKVWPKSIFAELLWFLSGSANNNDLEALGSKIWRPWVDSDFEKKHGFSSGDLGPVYGFQLRHFGADYKQLLALKQEIKETEAEYEKQCRLDRDFCDGNSWLDHHCVLPSTTIHYHLDSLYNKYEQIKGVDQLVYMVDTLKKDPDCRRNLFSLWNPKDLDKMRLAPCHYTFQVFVNNGKLSGSLTQRSCDFPIGVPANIQFYSALVYMLAQQCGLEPYEFVHYTVDAHIYENQIPAVETYLSRLKPDSPRLNLNKAENITSYKLEDFQLVDYNPLDKIDIPVAV